MLDDKVHKEIFIKAYDDYADAIYRHCYFRVFSKGRAEELVQETFLKVWEYMTRQEKEVENMRALLYRVATNLIIDHSRRKTEESLDAMMEESENVGPASDGRETMTIKLAFGEVMEVLKDFPVDDQHLIIMRYVDDLDPKEIADIKGMTANNISVKLHRVTEKLKKKLAKK